MDNEERLPFVMLPHMVPAVEEARVENPAPNDNAPAYQLEEVGMIPPIGVRGGMRKGTRIGNRATGFRLIPAEIPPIKTYATPAISVYAQAVQAFIESGLPSAEVVLRGTRSKYSMTHMRNVIRKNPEWDAKVMIVSRQKGKRLYFGRKDL